MITGPSALQASENFLNAPSQILKFPHIGAISRFRQRQMAELLEPAKLADMS